MRDFSSQLDAEQVVITQLVVLVRPQEYPGIRPHLGGMLEAAGQVSRLSVCGLPMIPSSVQGVVVPEEFPDSDLLETRSGHPSQYAPLKTVMRDFQPAV